MNEMYKHKAIIKSTETTHPKNFMKPNLEQQQVGHSTPVTKKLNQSFSIVADISENMLIKNVEK